jgi:tRNA (cmo5U34)-methyltransferase
MAQFHWDPDSYLASMSEEFPNYQRLQYETATATGTDAERLLELGTGTGETARRVLARHPTSRLVGIDASPGMLDHARAVLPADRVELRIARLEDPLPDGLFDVVFSTLAVHHLAGAGKAELFQRIASSLTRGGRFVLGDVVVPENLADVVIPVDGIYDMPSTITEQLEWLTACGLQAAVAWAHRDLVVLVGRAP